MTFVQKWWMRRDKDNFGKFQFGIDTFFDPLILFMTLLLAYKGDQA